MKTFIREIKQGIINLWKWFPIIWKDRDWDDHFIWEILKNKLVWQAKYIGKHDRHTTAELDVRRMLICAKLMDNIQDEFYSGEYMDYYESNIEWIHHSDGYEMKTQITSEHFDDYFKKYPLVYTKILTDNKLQIFKIEGDSESDVKERIAMNIGLYNHIRSKKLLFKIMEENIESWWD